MYQESRKKVNLSLQEVYQQNPFEEWEILAFAEKNSEVETEKTFKLQQLTIGADNFIMIFLLLINIIYF